jgi:hypothetical protein
MNKIQETALGLAMLKFERAQFEAGLRGPLPVVKDIPVPPKPCAEVKRLHAILQRWGPMDTAEIVLLMRKPASAVRGTIAKAMRIGCIRKIAPHRARQFKYEVAHEQ